MKLSPFAIYNVLDDPEIHISERAIFPSGRAGNTKGYKALALWIVVGSLSALSGFILLNVGTRELHWSAAVAQLVATLILTGIRAWVRRYVGDAPSIIKRLDARFAVAEIACDIYYADYLMMYGGNICFYSFFRLLEEVSISIVETPPSNDKATSSYGIEELYALDDHAVASMGILRRESGWTAGQRVFQTQSVWAEVQPGVYKTKDVTEQMLDAAVEILNLLYIPDIAWEQRVFFKGSAEFDPCLNLGDGKLEGLVKKPLLISDSEVYHNESRRTVQSLLSLTMYYFSVLRVFRSGALFRVLASCPVSEEHSQEWQKKEILGRGYDSSLETWIRTPDGRIDQEMVSKDTP